VPRGNYRQVIKCADPDCPEKVTYYHETRADEAKSVKDQRERPWKCSRHFWPERVLGSDREVIASVMTVTRRPDARTWESPLIWTGPGWPFLSDKVSGPGFQAFAGDWPEGTRLEITARILPAAGEPSGADPELPETAPEASS
jgi:hypothetical protein